MRKRISTFSVTGFFGSGDTEILALTYDAYNLDQKITRVSGAHTLKTGFRWAREIGFKSNPQTNRFTYASLDDLLANKASDFLLAMGNPPHRAWVDQFGGFIQDDWRVTDQFVLNLGLRYDYYPGFGYKSTDAADPAEVNNLSNPTDIRKMDFGAPRPLDKPIDDDKMNFAPRAGFAWTVDGSGSDRRSRWCRGVHDRSHHGVVPERGRASLHPDPPGLESHGAGGTRHRLAQHLCGRRREDHDRGLGRQEEPLLHVSDRHEESRDRAGHLRRAAANWKTGVGLGGLRPYQREEPADPLELCERLRSGDRRPAQPGRQRPAGGTSPAGRR